VNVVFVAEHPIPVGVVGVGSLGSQHARLYSDMPQACLVGVVDDDRERADAVAAEAGCEVFPDTEPQAAFRRNRCGEHRLDRYRPVPGKPRPGIDHERIVVGDEEPLRLQLESFLQAVARQSTPAVDGRAGLRAIELAHRVREAIESG